MDLIVGRHAEKRELDAAFNSKEAEFIAVYGRRRVGKTHLIEHFFEGKQCVYFQTTGIYKGGMDLQLARFAKELGTAFYSGATIKTPHDWMDALDDMNRAIEQADGSAKIVLFFDELPWMVTPKSGMLQALEYFWNRYWARNKRVKLVVCGSAASWIIKKIIKSRGGLHNRITRRIRLLPFNLHDTHDFLGKMGYRCDQQQTLRLYMVTGGVPFYLKQIKKRWSVEQNINRLFLDVNGAFFDEFDEIFASLFDHSEQYREFITLIARHKDGISRVELSERNKLTGKGGRVTKRLTDLENAGFITSFIPLFHKRRGVFYRISDAFCYFYLRWVEPVKMQLKTGQVSNYWRSQVNTPAYWNWMGYAFENICNQHIPQIKKALSIPEASFASPWGYTPGKGTQEQGAQIDLLFDRPDGALTLCEIKYSDKPFKIDKTYAKNLQNKVQVLRLRTGTKKQIFIALISPQGLEQTMYSEEMVSGVVRLDDLYMNIV